MSHPDVTTLIRRFDLKPHPEGGFYSETYRSSGTIAQACLPDTFHGDRAYATAIYFLLPAGARSCLHRIASDEIWHFYLGEPLLLVELHPDGEVYTVTLGHDIAQGHRLQHVVRAGCWFGACPLTEDGYALVGCTVSPGFDFAEFELASRQNLLDQFPQAAQWIYRLTDPVGA